MSHAVGGILIALAVTLVSLWLTLAIALAVKRPDRETLTAAARLPRDFVRLAKNLIGGESVPRAARVRLWLLVIYLASPIDLIPDFIPLVGYADDVIVAAILLRGTARAIGFATLARAWEGDARGLDVLRRLCGVAHDAAE